MNPDVSILTLRTWPAVVNVRQTAEALGMQPSHIPILCAAKMLRPLGMPARNGEKLFSSVEIKRLMDDPERLSKALRAVQQHFRNRNRRYAQSKVA